MQIAKKLLKLHLQKKKERKENIKGHFYKVDVEFSNNLKIC